MSAIVKICKFHGELTIEQVNKNKNKNRQTYRCKACQKEAHAKHWERHKEKVKIKQKEYRQENKETVRIIKHKSWQKNKWKYQERKNEINRNSYYKNLQANRKRDALRRTKHRILLTDGYIRRVITRRNKLLSAGDIPESIVQLKRVCLVIRRRERNINYDDKLREVFLKLGENNE